MLCSFLSLVRWDMISARLKEVRKEIPRKGRTQCKDMAGNFD